MQKLLSILFILISSNAFGMNQEPDEIDLYCHETLSDLPEKEEAFDPLKEINQFKLKFPLQLLISIEMLQWKKIINTYQDKVVFLKEVKKLLFPNNHNFFKNLHEAIPAIIIKALKNQMELPLNICPSQIVKSNQEEIKMHARNYAYKLFFELHQTFKQHITPKTSRIVVIPTPDNRPYTTSSCEYVSSDLCSPGPHRAKIEQLYNNLIDWLYQQNLIPNKKTLSDVFNIEIHRKFLYKKPYRFLSLLQSHDLLNKIFPEWLQKIATNVLDTMHHQQSAWKIKNKILL